MSLTKSSTMMGVALVASALATDGAVASWMLPPSGERKPALSTANTDPPAQPAPAADQPRRSNKALLEEYEAAGLALVGTPDMLADEPGSQFFGHSPGMPRLRKARAELIRRGAAVVPDLIEFLRREVPMRRPQAPDGGLRPGFTTDVIELLVTIGDPRATEVLVQIMGGFDGKATSSQVRAAMRGMERLTHCSFRKVEPHSETYAEAVKHPEARADDGALPTWGAKMYREWLQGEGKGPKKWLALAQERARRILATDDLPGIYNVANFLRTPSLSGGSPAAIDRDDQPDATLARLAELVADFRKGAEGYTWKGRPVPVHIANWTKLIVVYGPRARAQVKFLLRLHEESGLDNWDGFAQLRQVGGAEVMAYYFQCLPKVQTHSLRQVQTGIDRCAGRCFGNDAERLRWWEANKGKSEEDWLREGLPIVAAQADARNPDAIWIVEQMLPDLPPPHLSRPRPFPVGAEEPGGEPAKPVSRAAWLKENQTRLRYDERLAGFRLQKE